MDVVWVILGVLLVAATLLDIFLAVLNYEESGLFVNRLVRGAWIVMRTITMRTSRRWRPLVLRQVTGVLLLTTIAWWVAGIVLGFTFIYLGMLGDDAFQVSRGVTADFWGAFYLSFGQFATVGVDNISPGQGLANLLTVLQAMVSVVLLAFIITFLWTAYSVIQSLRDLSAHFFQTGRGIGDPIETLHPFFPDGQSRGLNRHLGSILDSLNAYSDGLAQNRTAYYFQSGRDQFSLPFNVYMTAGVIGALRWGLPVGSDPAKEPNLVRLAMAFEDLSLRMQATMGWATGPLPAAVSGDEFAHAVSVFSGPDSNSSLDPWVLRFLVTDHRMRELTRSSAAIVPEEAHRRYLEWLPFEVRSQRFRAALSRDLDYQPVHRGIAITPDGIPLGSEVDGSTLRSAGTAPETVGRTAAVRRRARTVKGWVRRRHLFIDPGYTRLVRASRSLVAVGVSVSMVITMGVPLGVDVASSAALAGLVTLFAVPWTNGWGTGMQRFAGLAAIVPAALGALLGTFIPKDPWPSIISIALLAAAAAWSGQFGPRVGGLGQLAFVTYYFTLLLSIDQRALGSALLAVGTGLLVSWLLDLAPGPSAERRIADGVDALVERVTVYLDTTIDVITSERDDRRPVRILRKDQVALRNTASLLMGQLDDRDTFPNEVVARELRVRVLDVQLAAENLITVLPDASSYAVNVEQRSQLAAELITVQRTVGKLKQRSRRADDQHVSREPPAEWPGAARNVHTAIHALSSAIDQLQHTIRRDAAASPSTDAGLGSLPAGSHRERAMSTAATSASGRQSVQAGVSTALALWLGSFVSTSHQLWAAMPAFQVLGGSDGETRRKGIQRVAATIAGAALAFEVAIRTGHNVIVVFGILGVSAFLMLFFQAVSSPWTSFVQTVLMATLYGALSTLNVETTETRMVETAIGAGVAVVVSALVLPTRTRTRVMSGMAVAIRTASELANVTLRPLGAGDPATPRQETSTLVGKLNGQMSEVQSVARPLRHNPGSLDRDSIEAQLTSLWAVLYYERCAVSDAAHIGDDDVVARQEWERLRQATEENFAAAQSVLEDRVPTRLHEDDEFIVDAGRDASVAVRSLLTQVQRLNQATLNFVETVKPGTVERDPRT